jgi:AcrR family transcriptional regulator
MKSAAPQSKKVRKNDSSESKLRIHKAAIEVFAKNGFAAASTRMIAKRAKLNISLISRYFGGKEQLFMSIIEGEVERAVKSDFDYPFRESFQDEVMSYIDFVYRSLKANIKLFRIVVAQSVIDPVFAKKIKNSVAPQEDPRLQVRLEKLKASGAIAADIDIRDLSLTIFTLATNQSICELLIFQTPSEELQKNAQHFLKILNRNVASI